MATIVISPVNVAQLVEEADRASPDSAFGGDGDGHFWVYMQRETRHGMAKRAVPCGK